ncbi:MAG TPA: GNAT family N-acetyltransferase [Pirellulales bacterium]|nr:GNAT family N-acetyltransferase [Pirellulales bacterium]
MRSWGQRRQFIALPWTLYQGDPNWIPPLISNQRELLNYTRHPFYDESKIQTFLAYRDGQPVGRIAAIVNAEHLKRYNDGRGFFGFFECIDDQSVAHALFDAARDWLAGHGLKRIRGPANPSMNYECGLLIEGFDSPATFMMTYNPPYHASLVESYGFRKGRDLLAYIGYRDQLPELEERLGPLADQAQRRCEADIRPLNLKKFREDVRLFLDLYNASLDINWGFVPLTDRELTKLAASLRMLLIPELTIIAESEGRGVGVIIGLPDYNPRIKEINGRLFPFGFLRLLSRKKDFKRIRVLSINVAPEFQRWGLGLVLMRALVPKAREISIEEAEFSWVDEENDLARLGLEKGGAKIYKTYRMYDYEPAGATS